MLQASVQMVTKKQGKRIIKEIKDRFGLVEKNGLLKRGVLTEQDITTKFVLPMLQALNWHPFKIAPEDGPEIHEKGFRETKIAASSQEKARRGGLPDFSLRRAGSDILFFVEVKHPSLNLNPERDLKKYRDGHLVFLTSFKKSMFVRVGKNRKKEECADFIACSPDDYVKLFDNLWHYVSNSYEAERTRAAVRAWRPGQRE
jgi:hypothetical protein